MSRSSSTTFDPSPQGDFLWLDFPDPRDDGSPCVSRCTVRFEQHRWRHIIEKHVCHREEPWDDWLTQDLANKLRHAWEPACGEHTRREVLGRASDLVEKEARECLGVPLALLYDNYQPATPGNPSSGQETWALVLPAGALLIIRSRPEGGAVCTCYFLKSAARCTNAEQRRLNLVRTLLCRYAELTTDGSWTPRALLQEDRELRIRFRFRTAVTWGLDGGQRQPRDATQDPWRRGADRPAPRKRLAPRQRY